MTKSEQSTKDRLISTATELIWKNSYSAVSVDGICKEADVKKGSFYHFFPSKSDLAMTVIETFYDVMHGYLQDIFSADKTPVMRFSDLADVMCRKQKEAYDRLGMVCGCPVANMGAEMAAQDETMRAKIEYLFSRQMRFYEDALGEMITAGQLPAETDVKARARDIYAYIMGQIMMARVQNDLSLLSQNLKPGIFRVIGYTEDIEKAA